MQNTSCISQFTSTQLLFPKLFLKTCVIAFFQSSNNKLNFGHNFLHDFKTKLSSGESWWILHLCLSEFSCRMHLFFWIGEFNCASILTIGTIRRDSYEIIKYAIDGHIFQTWLFCAIFRELYTTRKSYWLYHFFFLWGDILSFLFLYYAVNEVKEKTINHIMHSKTHRFFFFLLFILGPKTTWDNNILRERQFQKKTWNRGFWCLTTVKASKMFCCF